MSGILAKSLFGCVEYFGLDNIFSSGSWGIPHKRLGSNNTLLGYENSRWIRGWPLMEAV